MQTSIFITTTDVGMWVTPNKHSHAPAKLPELSTYQHQKNQCVSLRRNFNNGAFKTEKRPVLTTNRFSLQAGIKPPYKQN
jgi:hypothetical protein